ncbi:hypothetical protein PVK06_027639 [Gossypium arboreum]|uniref:Uncharacterized protein n=1 Tax=Gossypium arboreum TaxID=29729 RepID=A0ABR0P0S7_GOSAR|nr:hypothetical protein PVK06_027639 [Gossypium arboreum]
MRSWYTYSSSKNGFLIHKMANVGSPNGSAATIHNCYDYVGYVAWKKGDAGYGASFVITDGAGRYLKQFCKTIAVADGVMAKLLLSENLY